MRRELEPLLSEIRSTHLEILGGNLVGLYLHGSLALGGFNPRRSDVDYIAVVQAPPARETRLRLLEAGVPAEPAGAAERA